MDAKSARIAESEPFCHQTGQEFYTGQVY